MKKKEKYVWCGNVKGVLLTGKIFGGGEIRIILEEY